VDDIQILFTGEQVDEILNTLPRLGDSISTEEFIQAVEEDVLSAMNARQGFVWTNSNEPRAPWSAKDRAQIGKVVRALSTIELILAARGRAAQIIVHLLSDQIPIPDEGGKLWQVKRVLIQLRKGLDGEYRRPVGRGALPDFWLRTLGLRLAEKYKIATGREATQGGPFEKFLAAVIEPTDLVPTNPKYKFLSDIGEQVRWVVKHRREVRQQSDANDQAITAGEAKIRALERQLADLLARENHTLVEVARLRTKLTTATANLDGARQARDLWLVDTSDEIGLRHRFLRDLNIDKSPRRRS
jgi:hypothetical protein